MKHKPIKALYIEDDALDQQAFRRLIREKGLPWDLTIAETLAAARVQLARAAFDVIISDYHLPDGQGKDLFDEVHGIPIVLVTGTLEEQLAIRTLERGADDYLIKDTQQRYLEVLPLAVEKTLYRKAIHEREQQLARELRESEERFRLLVAGVKDYAIFMLDPNGYVATWNAGAQQLKGYTAEEIIGQHFSRFYTPEDVAQGKPAQGLATATEQGHLISEGWRVRKDGSRFWASVTITAIRDPDGRLRGFAKVTQDRTVYEQTTRLNARLAAIVASSQDAIISKDLQGIIQTWNNAAEMLFGYTAQEMVGQPMLRLLPPENAVEEEQILERLRHGERFEHYDTVRVAKDGRPIYVSVTVSPMRDRAGKIIGASTILRDITERKRAEERLRQTNEQLAAAKVSAEKAKELAEDANLAKDRFLAVLSHELRTPLTPVLPALAAVEKMVPVEGAEYLAIARRNIELEARLIDDLLDVTRIAQGKVKLERRPVEVCTVLQHAVDVCRPDIEAQQLHFRLQIAEGSPPVHGDPARLQQVFWNLIKNAVKFTPPGGCLAVRCWHDRGRALVEVADSGQGIASESLPTLFNAFEQEGRPSGHQFGGLGLGLAISKALVEMHGGALHAHSAGKGKGATFTIELPLVSAPHPPDGLGTLSPPPSTKNPPRGLRILLVEDHADTARIMSRLLQVEGHRVQHAPGVAAALDFAQRDYFDVLISDLGLSDGHGHDLMRQLVASGKSLPAIALSGYGMAADIQKSRDAGFAEHLTKPVNFETLLAALARVSGALSG